MLQQRRIQGGLQGRQPEATDLFGSTAMEIVQQHHSKRQQNQRWSQSHQCGSWRQSSL